MTLRLKIHLKPKPVLAMRRFSEANAPSERAPIAYTLDTPTADAEESV